jgi:hypothetical protein
MGCVIFAVRGIEMEMEQGKMGSWIKEKPWEYIQNRGYYV